MDEPPPPAPTPTSEIENTVYITEMLRAQLTAIETHASALRSLVEANATNLRSQLEADVAILREKIDGLPKTMRETNRADVAQLETRLTKSISENESRLIRWMIGIGIAGVGLVLAVLRLLPVTPTS